MKDRRGNMREKIHSVGAVVAFLGISGIAEAITGHGSGTISTLIFAAGLVMCLTWYVK
jgi:hypothetical protein